MKNRLTVTCVATLALIATATACGGSFDAVRYHNRAPVMVTNDRVDTPKPPADNPFIRMMYHSDSYFLLPARKATRVAPHRRAANVNSMDEVPDSTWFTNRIGAREMTVAEVRAGANRPGGPMAHKPWTVKSTKVGGASIGFIIKDAAGDTYLLKFDQADLPEAETAADVIAAKLLWAVGYNVSEDYIVRFKPEDLKLADDAEVKPEFGKASPLTPELLAANLSQVHAEEDGTIRGLTSRFLSGKPLDGWPREGVREGDPNDKVAHEKRRELRGAYAIFSWLSHSDIKEDNTLDMYVEDPADPNVHYVKHYLIDIGKTFGVQEAAQKMKYVSHEYLAEPQALLKQLATLGLRKRSWEGRRSADLVGVGLWESENYNPGSWTAATPNYLPLLAKDKWDAFWGAKILIRFSEEQLRAAVSTGEYSDPRAAEYVVRVLIERQKKTAAYWFNRVNPLDNFEVKTAGGAATLCFDDLMVKHKLGGGPATYTATTYDYDGKKIAAPEVSAGDGGRACVAGLVPSKSTDGYLIVELKTARAGSDTEPTLVHLAVDPEGGALRLIGLRRL